MKIKFILLSILFMFSCDDSSLNSNNDSELSGLFFVPEEVQINLGQSFQLELAINQPYLSIFGISFALEFNPELISFSDEDDLTLGSLLPEESIQFIHKDMNTIHVTLSLLQGQDEIVANGSLCSFEFIGIQSGITQLSIIPDFISLYNSSGNTIQNESIELSSSQIEIN